MVRWNCIRCLDSRRSISNSSNITWEVVCLVWSRQYEMYNSYYMIPMNRLHTDACCHTTTLWNILLKYTAFTIIKSTFGPLLFPVVQKLYLKNWPRNMRVIVENIKRHVFYCSQCKNLSYCAHVVSSLLNISEHVLTSHTVR